MALNPFYRNRPLFGFDDFFTSRDPWDDSLLMPVVPNLDRANGSIIRLSSPGYEINEVDGKFQIAVDVPGVKAKDMTVNVEQEGHVLRIAGGRKVIKEGQSSETKFEKRFTVGENVDLEKMTADLSDGVLTLTAPKKEEERPKTRTIAITEGKTE